MQGSPEISTCSVYLYLMQMFSKQFYPFKDFSIWTNTEELSWKIHCPLRMQECRFEFETSCSNNWQFIFQILDSLMQSWRVCLTCLDCKGHLSTLATFFFSEDRLPHYPANWRYIFTVWAGVQKVASAGNHWNLSRNLDKKKKKKGFFLFLTGLEHYMSLAWVLRSRSKLSQ